MSRIYPQMYTIVIFKGKGYNIVVIPFLFCLFPRFSMMSVYFLSSFHFLKQYDDFNINMSQHCDDSTPEKET